MAHGGHFSCFLSQILNDNGPGDNSNQCAQGYNCPPPSVTLDPYSPFGNRYVDVGAGGPVPFTFTVKSNASWVTITPSNGNISPKDPETRVFVSVNDWNKLNNGQNAATLTFTATTKDKQKPLSVTVNFFANRYSLPGDFKGE